MPSCFEEGKCECAPRKIEKNKNVLTKDREKGCKKRKKKQNISGHLTVATQWLSGYVTSGMVFNK